MSFVDFAKLRDAIQIQSPAATDGLEGVASEAAPVASPAEYDALDAALCALQIELCENTMQQKGVEPTELMPGVNLVVGAFPRLIDLQLQGFAYIKFE